MVGLLLARLLTVATHVNLGFGCSIARGMASGSGQAASSDRGLTEDDLGELYEALYPMRKNYKPFGLQIGVKKNEIEMIEKQEADPGDRLLEILSVRLKQSEVLRWKDIDKALKSKSVGEGKVADCLQELYGPLFTDQQLEMQVESEEANRRIMKQKRKQKVKSAEGDAPLYLSDKQEEYSKGEGSKKTRRKMYSGNPQSYKEPYAVSGKETTQKVEKVRAKYSAFGAEQQVAVAKEKKGKKSEEEGKQERKKQIEKKSARKKETKKKSMREEFSEMVSDDQDFQSDGDKEQKSTREVEIESDDSTTSSETDTVSTHFHSETRRKEASSQKKRESFPCGKATDDYPLYVSDEYSKGEGSKRKMKQKMYSEKPESYNELSAVSQKEREATQQRVKRREKTRKFAQRAEQQLAMTDEKKGVYKEDGSQSSKPEKEKQTKKKSGRKKKAKKKSMREEFSEMVSDDPDYQSDGDKEQKSEKRMRKMREVEMESDDSTTSTSSETETMSPNTEKKRQSFPCGRVTSDYPLYLSDEKEEYSKGKGNMGKMKQKMYSEKPESHKKLSAVSSKEKEATPKVEKMREKTGKFARSSEQQVAMTKGKKKEDGSSKSERKANRKKSPRKKEKSTREEFSSDDHHYQSDGEKEQKSTREDEKESDDCTTSSDTEIVNKSETRRKEVSTRKKRESFVCEVGTKERRKKKQTKGQYSKHERPATADSEQYSHGKVSEKPIHRSKRLKSESEDDSSSESSSASISEEKVSDVTNPEPSGKATHTEKADVKLKEKKVGKTSTPVSRKVQQPFYSGKEKYHDEGSKIRRDHSEKRKGRERASVIKAATVPFDSSSTQEESEDEESDSGDSSEDEEDRDSEQESSSGTTATEPDDESSAATCNEEEKKVAPQSKKKKEKRNKAAAPSRSDIPQQSDYDHGGGDQGVKKRKRRHKDTSAPVKHSSSSSTSPETSQRQPNSRKQRKTKSSGQHKGKKKGKGCKVRGEGLASSSETDDSTSPECDMSRNLSDDESKKLSKIFKRFFGRLCCEVANPAGLAAQLQQDNLVSQETMIHILRSPESEQEKTISLVSKLSKRIDSRPYRLYRFIEVLLRNDGLKEAGKELLKETGMCIYDNIISIVIAECDM